MNRECNVHAMPAPVNSFSVPEIVRGSDVVIDVSDSVTARYTLNETCTDQGVPFVTGIIVGVQGQVFTAPPIKLHVITARFRGRNDQMNTAQYQ